jgi:hypothetical protein
VCCEGSCQKVTLNPPCAWRTTKNYALDLECDTDRKSVALPLTARSSHRVDVVLSVLS